MIHTMRTYFKSPDGPISSREFAVTMLTVRKQAVRQQLVTMGFVQSDLLNILQYQLGDPDKAIPSKLVPYVSGGAWQVKCDECGNDEYADFDDPIFMCCGCWNVAVDHQWRQVTLPTDDVRSTVEEILLARPEPKTRTWLARDETPGDLANQNAEHGVPLGTTSEKLAAVKNVRAL